MNKIQTVNYKMIILQPIFETMLRAFKTSSVRKVESIVRKKFLEMGVTILISLIGFIVK